ncbi:hypothetical protein [Actinoplanes sp. G11-F43]|uniref:hypothetical protein n=1 Tax=Actinoplanes sp. G11-F43 TaxID=3424130 RepID=UPI003D3563CF
MPKDTGSHADRGSDRDAGGGSGRDAGGGSDRDAGGGSGRDAGGGSGRHTGADRVAELAAAVVPGAYLASGSMAVTAMTAAVVVAVVVFRRL